MDENQNDITSEDKKKFNKMSKSGGQSELMNFNDDLLFLMITHVLTIGIAISSGYHDSHFAVGKRVLSPFD